MNTSRTFLFCILCISPLSVGANDTSSLQQQIDQLTQRVEQLKQQIKSMEQTDRWRDPVYWQRIKKGMTEQAIEKLLGKPARIENRIFTTWYYHQTSKIHSYIWFDEGSVLGWELPD